MFNNYIIDLDGTIIDSSNQILFCIDKAFKKVGYKIDKNKLTSNIIGPPIKEIIALLAPELYDENIINSIIKNFRQLYDNEENDISELYVGLYDFLRELKYKQKKLFIATLKPSKPTKRIIDQFKLNMFDDIYTIDIFDRKITKKEMIIDIIQKFNLKKNETVMIGDSISDMLAAQEVNIFGIGVLWGYCSDEIGLKNNSNKVVSNIKELKECLKLNYQTI